MMLRNIRVFSYIICNHISIFVTYDMKAILRDKCHVHIKFDSQTASILYIFRALSRALRAIIIRYPTLMSRIIIISLQEKSIMGNTFQMSLRLRTPTHVQQTIFILGLYLKPFHCIKLKCRFVVWVHV